MLSRSTSVKSPFSAACARTPSRASPATSCSSTAGALASDAKRYTEREAQNKSVAQFQGGSRVVVIGGSTVVIILLVVLLIVLL